MGFRYDVYGIGNALVDMEIEVSDAFLTDQEIEKGLMTLVDHERQNFLLEKVDGNQHKRACGGSAANTMIGLSQFGGKGFYSCKVAEDEPGEFYFQDLRENGLETNLTEGRASGGVTGKCMVFITPDAERTMNTYLGITETFSTQELRPDHLKESQFLYIEGYLVTSDTGRAAAIEAKRLAEENKVKTSMTFSDPSMTKYFREGLKELIGENPLDLLFCNEEELTSFTGIDNFEAACEELKKFAKSFAITRGAKGAFLFDGKHEIEVVTNQVEPIDTNGAGDLFAGAFLYGLTSGHSYAESGRLACAASSVLVTQFGPRLKRDQAMEIREKMFQG